VVPAIRRGMQDGEPVRLLSEHRREHVELHCGCVLGLTLLGRMTASSRELGPDVGTLLCRDNVRSPKGEGR